jgi:nitrogen fixation NifU-like protein
MNLDDIYRETILDHNQIPRNKGTLKNPSASVGLLNPTCGDQIRLDVQVENGKIVDIRFDGHGCAISMASASMMTEAVKGLSVEEGLRVAGDFKAFLIGETPSRDLGELTALEGVSQFPSRVKCATLAHNALEKALGSDAAH